MPRTQLELPDEVATELAGPVDVVMKTLEGHLDCEVFLRGNVLTLDAGLVDAAQFDYHLVPGSPCRNQGVPAGSAADGTSLIADFQYRHPLAVEARPSDALIDSGAFELSTSSAWRRAGRGCWR